MAPDTIPDGVQLSQGYLDLCLSCEAAPVDL
jgi:hypothetical protein